MAQQGAGRQLLATLAEAVEAELGDADQRNWLLGPLVVHSSAWIPDLPDWMKKQAYAERWLIVAGNLPDHIVGPSEIACVMYGASLESPLSSDTSAIYIWAAHHAVVRHSGLQSDAAKAAAEINDRTDEQILTPGSGLNHEYRQLAFEIRRKVAKARLEEGKQQRRRQRAA
jgi:hypothetical protein